MQLFNKVLAALVLLITVAQASPAPVVGMFKVNSTEVLAGLMPVPNIRGRY